MDFEKYIVGRGLKKMEDGRFTDGESAYDLDQLRQMFGEVYDYQGGDSQPGPSQTPTIIGKQGFQTFHNSEGAAEYDADPFINGVQYRSIPGDPDSVAQLKSRGLDVQQHPEYGWIAPDDAKYAAVFPDRSSSSIFDFGPLLIAAFMVPAIASSLAAAGTAAGAGAVAGGAPAGFVGADFGATIPYSAGSTAGFSAAQQAAGLTAAQAAGAEVGATSFTAAQQAAALSAAGGGLIGGATGAATASGGEAGGAVAAPEAAPLSAGQEAAQSIAQEWGNYVDPWASGNAEAVANSGVAGDMGVTVESAVTRAGDITDLAKAPTPPSNTQNEARKLVQSAEDVTSAEGGSGAFNAVSGAGTGGSLLDKIWKGLTSPQGTAAAITTIGGIASGIGAATLNRETMQDKADLDLRNATALQQAKTDQSRANMFRGIIGVRPAATRAPLQRLTGGSVYGPTGLIRRA